MDEQTYVYCASTEYSSALKKNELLTCTSEYISLISLTGNKKNMTKKKKNVIVYFFIYMTLEEADQTCSVIEI